MNRDRFETSESPIRYLYVRPALPWLLASSPFVYGLDDEQNIPKTSDSLSNKRDIRGSGYKLSAALLCAFYQFEPFSREVIEQLFRKEIQEHNLVFKLRHEKIFLRI